MMILMFYKFYWSCTWNYSMNISLNDSRLLSYRLDKVFENQED